MSLEALRPILPPLLSKEFDRVVPSTLMRHHGRSCRVDVGRGHSFWQPIVVRLLILTQHLCLVRFQQPLLGLVVNGHVSRLCHHSVVEIVSYLLNPDLSLLAFSTHQALSEGLSDLPQLSPRLDLPRHLI